jgi:hypothetical protein
MGKFQFIVTIECDTADEASTVIHERTNYDEDYGFNYTISAEPVGCEE